MLKQSQSMRHETHENRRGAAPSASCSFAYRAHEGGGQVASFDIDDIEHCQIAYWRIALTRSTCTFSLCYYHILVVIIELIINS